MNRNLYKHGTNYLNMDRIKNLGNYAIKGLKRKPLSEETKKKISKANKGRKLSEEHIKKLKNNPINKTSFKKGHAGFRGEKNGNWKGDVLKGSVHDWLSDNFKKEKCDFCGKTKDLEWANKDNKHLQYLKDRNKFFVLCINCHKRYDWNPNKIKRNNEGKFIKLEGGIKNG